MNEFKQETKEQKGITLIALIITIIVLLILAVVAIGAVQNDGIINYAKNARDEYGKAQEKENSILQDYIDTIEDEIEESGKKVTFYVLSIEEYYDKTPAQWQFQQYQAKSGTTWKNWIEETKFGSGWIEVGSSHIGENIGVAYFAMAPDKKQPNGNSGLEMVDPNDAIVDRCVLFME